MHSRSEVPCSCRYLLVFWVIGWTMAASTPLWADDDGDRVSTLAREVAPHGWIVFAAHPAEIEQQRVIADKSQRGQLDLYLARPDGMQLRNITNTAEFSEFGGRFTPDGRHLLYRRLPKEVAINHDLWGATGCLIVANANGSDLRLQGESGAYPWASFGADMKQIACLYKQERKIRIFDFASKKLVREMPSQGVFQQLFWAPDGKHVVGTANIQGRNWNVVSINVRTGRRTVLTRALNCTPDWFQGDPNRVIYSNRNPALFPGQYDNYGLTMLMQATVDGKHRKLIYGNAARHCYFGCTSPDDEYVIFCDDAHDGLVTGDIHVIRLSDTPVIPVALKSLKLLFPDSHTGPVLDWKHANGVAIRGFEPHWTNRDVGGGE